MYQYWANGAIERIMQVNRSDIARHHTKLDMVSDVTNAQDKSSSK